jgi:hypothetical protein
MAGCCEHDSEILGSVKGWEFLHCLSVLTSYEEKYFCGRHIKENEMSEICNTHGRLDKHIHNFNRKI